MTTMLGRASRLALDLLFPPKCALCGTHETLLCGLCASLLPAAIAPRCDECWMPVTAAPICGHCAAQPPSFVELRAPFVMANGARDLAHALKYEGLTSLAEPMAALMLPALTAETFATIDVIVPVPLHPGRERSRGYNQAAELARHLAALADRAVDTRAVRRMRDTAPLAKGMHRDERRAIVAGAFRASPERCTDRRILLVDDVATTGATLDACGGALLDAGAASVRCLVWARAD